MSQITLNNPKLPARSMGVKLIVVCFLALVMTIPAFFVWSLIDDRSHRADEVVNEVSEPGGRTADVSRAGDCDAVQGCAQL